MSQLRIASPCAADWNAMRPVDGGRHCALCSKDVVDLTCLDPVARADELARLTARVRAGERICINAPSTRDGYVLSRSRRILTGGMAAMLAMAMAGCQEDGAAQKPARPQNLDGHQPRIPVEPGTQVHMRGEYAVVPEPSCKLMIGEADGAVPAPTATTPQAPHAAQ